MRTGRHGLRESRPRARAALALAALALLGGCAFAPPGTVAYRCTDGSRFELRANRGGDGAHVVFDGMTFGLRREPAATGARYACDVLSVWTDGTGARLDVQGRVRECAVVR